MVILNHDVIIIESNITRRAHTVGGNDDDSVEARRAYPMDMIGHDDEFIQFDMLKSTG